MPDVHSAEARSRNMAAIRGQDTRPEILIRKGLFAAGFRYRLHDRQLPGRPDLVLPKYRAVIFINGCFWHGHDCPMFRWPETREEFWREKIRGNIARDQRNHEAVDAMGWRRAVIWECALKGGRKVSADAVVRQVAKWLTSEEKLLNIKGK